MDQQYKRKVLFFLNAGIGGAEKMTVNIAKMLNQSEFDVVFVLVDKAIREIKDFIPASYDKKLLKIRNIWDFTTIKMVRLMRKERPYVVFCSFRYMNPRVILAAKIVGNIKVVVRNDLSMEGLSRLTLRMIEYTYPKADYIVAQTEQMRKEIINSLPVKASKVVALHNPVDTVLINKKLQDEVNPYKNNGLKYVATSRIVPIKGHEVLIRAFSIVKQTEENSHLYIIGNYHEDVTYYQSLCSLVEELHLKDSVHFIGYSDNPYVWIKYADCFVLSSRSEGLPNTLIEATFIGLPAVATTSIEVIKEIIKDGYNGYTVPMDDVKAMAEAMKKAVSLKDFEMTYKQATKEQFVSLFK